MRFNQYGDCTVPGHEGQHVTEFENADLTLTELHQKLAALEEEGGREEDVVELKKYIQNRELQYEEPTHLENQPTSIVQQRLKEAAGLFNVPQGAIPISAEEFKAQFPTEFSALADEWAEASRTDSEEAEHSIFSGALTLYRVGNNFYAADEEQLQVYEWNVSDQHWVYHYN
jgi:hypothetical protein